MSTKNLHKADPKKVEKSASQNSTGGSVSGAAAAAKEKRKKEGKDKKGGDSPSVSPATSNVGVIKAPGGKKEEAAVGRRSTSGASMEKEKTEKGILKNKKSRVKAGEVTKKPKAKVKPKGKQRSLFDKIALALGFYVGDVTLTDPYAIEAAQALDLQPWHLRRLKMRFDKIDLDGSGNIDYDEFFESIGEMRSPFTDKLFALIGTRYFFARTCCCRPTRCLWSAWGRMPIVLTVAAAYSPCGLH
jgi:hypothetical protein